MDSILDGHLKICMAFNMLWEYYLEQYEPTSLVLYKSSVQYWKTNNEWNVVTKWFKKWGKLLLNL